MRDILMRKKKPFTVPSNLNTTSSTRPSLTSVSRFSLARRPLLLKFSQFTRPAQRNSKTRITRSSRSMLAMLRTSRTALLVFQASGCVQ